MWENISRADLDQAKQDLKLRRDELLRRHAEELSAIDAEQGEIETLERFIVAFVEKFRRADPSSPQALAGEPTESSATHAEGEQAPQVTTSSRPSPASAGNFNLQHSPARVARPWDVEAIRKS